MNFSKHILFLFILLPGIFILTAASAPAAGRDTYKNGDPLHIQLPAMRVDIKVKGSVRATNVTIFLEIRNTKYTKPVCKRLPQIRSKMLSYFNKNPIPTSKGKLEIASIRKGFLATINKALGKKVITGTVILPGSYKSGRTDRFPSAAGCRALHYISAEGVRAKFVKQ